MTRTDCTAFLCKYDLKKVYLTITAKYKAKETTFLIYLADMNKNNDRFALAFA